MKGTTMVQLGENGHLYEVSGDNFGKLPDGWFYREPRAWTLIPTTKSMSSVAGITRSLSSTQMAI